MTKGTKSLIAGAHCLLLHPVTVAVAWGRLFGFPWDPRIWASCYLHDIGYIGRDELEGPGGEEHVVLGARIAGWLFGPKWARECYLHSRYWSRRMGLPVSRLCLADKLAFAMMPAWLYIPMARWTGELAEYMERSRDRQAGDASFTDEEVALIQSSEPREWLRGLQAYTRRWVERQFAESVKEGLVRGLGGEREPA
jgi:hypothetical protein